jgi:hypothetical protein
MGNPYYYKLKYASVETFIRLILLCGLVTGLVSANLSGGHCLHLPSREYLANR